MAENRFVTTNFWNDPYVETLSPDGKYLFLYLITNKMTNMCGLYPLSINVTVVDTGLRREVIMGMLEKFTTDNKIYYAEGLVFIKNYAKHQKGAKFGFFNEHVIKQASLLYDENNLAYQEFIVFYQDVFKEFVEGFGEVFDKGFIKGFGKLFGKGLKDIGHRKKELGNRNKESQRVLETTPATNEECVSILDLPPDTVLTQEDLALANKLKQLQLRKDS